MEGVRHKIVMNAEEADRFFEGLNRPFHYMADAVDKVIYLMMPMIIGKATEETQEQESFENSPILAIKRAITHSSHNKRNPYQFPKAITVSGWLGLGKERLVKYVTKRVMHRKLFDTLIWMMGKKENLSLKNFQRLIAEGLNIPLGRHDGNDDDSDPDDVDKVVSDKIRMALQDRNFLLVHKGGWGQEDLRSIGIPSIKGQSHSMILVASTEPRYNHEHLSFDADTLDSKWLDLLLEECSPSQRKAHINITPQTMCICAIYSAYLKQYMKVEVDNVQLQMVRYWFAEGIIGDAILDLETVFKQGNTILEELQHLYLIQFVSKLSSSGKFIPRTYLCIGYEKLNNPKTKGETDTFEFFAIDTNPSPNLSKVTTIILCPRSSVESYNTMLPENFLEKTKCLQVLTFMSTTTLSKLPSSVLHLANSLRFLNLRNCKSLVQVPYLNALVKLQILDLSNTSLEELPPDSFENLQHLRLLDLTECVKLSNLPSSISRLLNLEQLLLGGCGSLNVLPSHILPLEKLQILDLSRTILAEIPEQFFRSMISLKDLNLSFNSHLTSLPKSISNLVNLKKLNLESCSSLRILSFSPHHLPLSLEELNLSNSSCLQGISSFSSSSGDMIPNLRVLNISGIQLQRISFKNYTSLENIILQSNTNLQFLDLSGTKLTKFPLEGTCKPHLNGFTRLDLLGVKHIRSVDWNDIAWLPHEVNWDECGDGSIAHMQIPPSKWRKEGSGGVFLSLTSAKILQTLSPSSQLWETCLLRFLVYICPCADRGKGKAAHPQKKLSHYKNINTRLNPCPPCYERCLEIEGGNMFRRGISILSHTNFLYLHDSTFKLFSNLGLENMNALTECRMERCHEIERIFDVPFTKIKQPLLMCLENLQISNLMKLTYMCTSERTLNKQSFSSLKHLQLEYCARVVQIFSAGVFLRNLEVLNIKFCARLEEIFSGAHEQGSFPQLQTLFLLELPSLKHIVRDVPLLSLKKAQIKGCPKLRTLPLSSSQGRPTVDASIVIKGESEWWEQLEWKDNSLKPQICFIPWKPFKYPRGT